MLPRPARLTSSRDFQAVFSKGRSFATDLLVIHVLPQRSGGPRFGFSVSSKVGKSVVRNRVKRLLREAARSRLEQIRRSCDVVLVARAKCKEANFAQVSESTERLLRKMGLIEPGAESSEGQ